MEQNEIALIGKIAAGMTHEMKNVLAIIKESNGLMQDVLRFSKEASFPHQEKLSNALEKIEKHVGRGVEMMTQFNKFAHSMDEARGWVEVNEIVDLVVSLLQRFARHRQVTLSADPLHNTPPLYTKPARLILALSACVDYCLDRAHANGTIVINPEKVERKVAFNFLVHQGSEGEVGAEMSPDELQEISENLLALDGELHLLEAPSQPGLSLVLPLSKE